MTVKIVKYSLLAVALCCAAVCIITILLRIHYPFELEWCEGATFGSVLRILEGKALYVKPSWEFTSAAYTPLYYYVSAAAAKILGMSFFPLRLVSFVSSLFCFFFIYLIVKKETKDIFSAVLASSMYAATFPISGFWFDLARVDGLYLALFLAACYLARFKPSRASYIISGILMAMSYFTKQVSTSLCAFIILYVFFTDRKRSFFLIATAVLIIGIVSAWLNISSKGWYNFYAWKIPMHVSILKGSDRYFWVTDIVRSIGIAFSFGAAYIIIKLAEWKRDRKSVLFYLLLFAGGLVTSFFVRIHYGAFNNTVLPAYAAIAILFGLAVNSVIRYAADTGKRSFEVACYVICLIQFSSLVYSPRAVIPSSSDLAAGKEMIKKIGAIKGDVLLFDSGYLTAMAGKSYCAHFCALDAVLSFGGDERAQALVDDIKQAVADKRFGALMVRWPDTNLYGNLTEQYQYAGPLFDKGDVFRPKSGDPARVEELYLLKADRK